MNEQLQVALTEILNNTIEATGKATDFLVAEIPDVLQQLLMWKMCESLMWFIFGILSIPLSLICMRITFNKLTAMYKESTASYSENLSPLCLFWILGMIPLAGIDLIWLQIWLAPKVYLLEYAASLAK